MRVDQSLVERPYIGKLQGQVINRGRWQAHFFTPPLFRSQALIDIGDCGVKENERKTDPAIDAEKTDVARVGSFSDGSSEHR